jgi:hypothetical protein
MPFRLRRFGPGARLLCLGAGAGGAADRVFANGPRSVGHRVVWSLWDVASRMMNPAAGPRAQPCDPVHILVVRPPSKEPSQLVFDWR